MMKSLPYIGLISVACMFSGCTTVPMKPKTFHELGQFQHIPLNSSTHRIQFKADPHFSYGHAEEITLVKSAQFTLQQGFDFFKVVDDPSNRLNQHMPRQTVVYPQRSMWDHYNYHPRYRNHPLLWNDPFFDTPYTVELDPVEVSYTIQLYKKALAPADAFEARRILEALGDKYQLNPDGSTKIIPPHPSLAK